MSTFELGMVVSDLDGTLLGHGSELLPENGRALRACVSRGIPVAIASGRLAGVCSRIAREMGLESCWIIGMNGAQMWDAPFGTVVENHVYPEELRQRCVGILEKHGCAYNLYAPQGVYTNQKLDETRLAHFRKSFRDSGCCVVNTPDVPGASAEQPCIKFLVKNTNGQQAYERAKAEFEAMPEVYTTTSAKGNFELMLKGLGKAEAVTALAQRLGIPLKNVAAFGDYDNDVPMLTACGLSVAMGNALPEARAAARFATIDHDQSGVAWAVDHMLRGEWDILKKPER